jgi:hypothetical protein
MSEELNFKLTIDGVAAAQAQIDKFRASMNGGSEAVTKIDKAIKQTELDMKALTAAIAAGGPNVDQYKNALNGLAASKRNVGQAALELSRGVEDLQYGFGGIVNNIPSLVMSLGGGAGLTAAISLAAVGINQLSKRFADYHTEADKIKIKNEQLAASMRDLRAAVQEDAKKSVDSLDTMVTDLDKKIATFGKKESQKYLYDAQIDLSENKQKIIENEERLNKNNLVIMEQQKIIAAETLKLNGRAESSSFLVSSNLKKAREQLTAATIESRSAEINIGASQAAINSLELRVDEVNRRAKSLEHLEDAAEKNKKKKGPKEKTTDYHEIYEAKKAINERMKAEELFYEDQAEKRKFALDSYRETKNGERAINEIATKEEIEMIAYASDNYVKELFKRINARRKMYDQQDKDEEKLARLTQSRTDEVNRYARRDMFSKMASDNVFTQQRIENIGKLKQAEIDALKEQRDVQREHYKDTAQFAKSAAGSMTSSFQEYLSLKIEGNKYAEELMIASIMKQAGQALVGYGIESIGQGAAFIASQNYPAGAQALAIGAALTASGVGLGAGSASINYGVQVKSKADSDAEREAEKAKKKAEKDAGVSSGRSGLNSGGGGIVLNLSYGVAGPLPEDTARMIQRELSQAQRRGLS